MENEILRRAQSIVSSFDPGNPRATADALRALWLQAEPKSIDGIKAEQRAQQETVGIPVEVLRSIGKELGKTAHKRISDYIPMIRLLWDEYGREGRVVALIPLGKMELADPGQIIPLSMTLCRTCVTWEDADRLAMDALEPAVRKAPEQWLPAVEPWLHDENKWVRRAGVTVVGRLPIKHSAYAARCVALAEELLLDQETDVKKAVSFALRLSARGDVAPVHALLSRHVPPQDEAATWVLCDTIRSMAKKLLPAFASLLALYEQWAADPALNARDQRSVESAVKVLKSVSG